MSIASAILGFLTVVAAPTLGRSEEVDELKVRVAKLEADFADLRRRGREAMYEGSALERIEQLERLVLDPLRIAPALPMDRVCNCTPGRAQAFLAAQQQLLRSAPPLRMGRSEMIWQREVGTLGVALGLDELRLTT